MNNTIKYKLPVFIAVPLMMMLSVSSCEKNEEIIPVTIQFESKELNIHEGSETLITLTLTRPAPKDAVVSIKIQSNAVYGQHYTVEPDGESGILQLQVKKGDQSITFKVKTIDTSVFDDNLTVTFIITDASNGMATGFRSSLNVEILDDEGPSIANFELESGNVDENNEAGIVVKIPLSIPTQGTGSLFVYFNPGKARYGIDFTTEPEKSGNTNVLELQVESGSIETGFKIIPINNEVFNGELGLSFEFSNTTGAIKEGPKGFFNLHIIDDELPSLANFQSANGALDEGDTDGLTVEIPLSSPVKGEGKILIKLLNGQDQYGSLFTTEPAIQNGFITLNLDYNATSAAFKIYPVDDDNYVEPNISFVIWQTEGVIKIGSNINYDLNLIDNEVAVNFTRADGSVDEDNSNGFEIELQLTQPSPVSGNIVIAYVTNWNYSQNFTFEPAPFGNTIVLPVQVGQTSVSLNVIPKYDASCSNRSINFRITAVLNGLAIGSKTDFYLSIRNTDGALVNFTEAEGSVTENGIGKVIEISLSEPAPDFADIIVTPSDYGFSQRYKTNPDMSYDWDFDYYSLNLEITKDQSKVQFNVYPLNNQLKDGNYSVSFYLSGYTGQCIRIADNAIYKLTIVDDD